MSAEKAVAEPWRKHFAVLKEVDWSQRYIVDQIALVSLVKASKKLNKHTSEALPDGFEEAFKDFKASFLAARKKLFIETHLVDHSDMPLTAEQWAEQWQNQRKEKLTIKEIMPFALDTMGRYGSPVGDVGTFVRAEICRDLTLLEKNVENHRDNKENLGARKRVRLYG